jgi:hypothetical protein
MTYATRAAAVLSLIEFSPAMRRLHRVIRVWVPREPHGCYRYMVQFRPKAQG